MHCTITAATLLACVAATAAPLPTAVRQGKQFPLVSAEGLRLHSVSAEPATLHGKKGLRLTISADAVRRFASMTPEQQAGMEQLAILDGLQFGSGVIEAEIAGAVAPGAAEGARQRPPRTRSAATTRSSTCRIPTGPGSVFANGKGVVVLWLGPGTVAHFRNLTVQPGPR
jgi:hypothetical protein